MQNNNLRIFVAALEVLIDNATNLRDLALSQIEDEDSFFDDGEIHAFDEAVEIVLHARNSYCDETERSIEDGSVSWKKSSVQQNEAGDGS